jgi:signal transduction histidine kinase
VHDSTGRRVAGGARVGADATEVTVRAHRGATVTAREPASEVGDRVRGLWLLIGLLSAGGVAAVGGLALVQARRLARPLERLARDSERLGRGDFAVRPDGGGVPEVERVAGALGQSARRIERLVAREREFSANVTHQLRTPLTALRLRVEELEHAADLGEVRTEADAALEQVDRLERTVDGLLAHARDERAGDPGPVDLAEVARRLAVGWEPLFGAHRRSLVVAGASMPVLARAERATAEQALEVLLDNALHHGGTRVRLVVGRRGPAAVAAVEDDGDGVPPGAEERIFARRVSSDGGDGIGLALARDLVDATGGRLVLARARPPRFELLLPGVDAAGSH